MKNIDQEILYVFGKYPSDLIRIILDYCNTSDSLKLISSESLINSTKIPQYTLPYASGKDINLIGSNVLGIGRPMTIAFVKFGYSLSGSYFLPLGSILNVDSILCPQLHYFSNKLMETSIIKSMSAYFTMAPDKLQSLCLTNITITAQIYRAINTSTKEFVSTSAKVTLRTTYGRIFEGTNTFINEIIPANTEFILIFSTDATFESIGADKIIGRASGRLLVE